MDYLMNVASTEALIKAIASWALLNTETVTRASQGSTSQRNSSDDKDALKDLIRLTEALAIREDIPQGMAEKSPIINNTREN